MLAATFDYWPPNPIYPPNPIHPLNKRRMHEGLGIGGVLIVNGDGTLAPVPGQICNEAFPCTHFSIAGP